MAINVKINKRTSDQLTKLSAKRKVEMALNKTKQDLTAEAVERLFNEEFKDLIGK